MRVRKKTRYNLGTTEETNRSGARKLLNKKIKSAKKARRTENRNLAISELRSIGVTSVQGVSLVDLSYEKLIKIYEHLLDKTIKA